MMDIHALIQQTVILFAIILLGYAAQKTRLLPEDSSKVISNLVINVTNPCTVLASVFSSGRLLSNGQTLLFFALTWAVYGVMILVAQLVPKVMGAKSKQVGLYRFLTVFANVGFLGIPVLRALLGPDAVFLVAILLIPFNLLVYTYGITQVAGDPSQRKLPLKMFFSPMLVACYLSIILYVANVKIPEGVLSLVRLVDGATSPLAMMAIGCSLAAFPLKKVFSNYKVYIFALIKLILLPVLIWALLSPWLKDELMLGVQVASCAMPCATNVTLLATKYDGDVELGASGVFITTMLCLVTLPLVLSILF